MGCITPTHVTSFVNQAPTILWARLAGDEAACVCAAADDCSYIAILFNVIFLH